MNRYTRSRAPLIRKSCSNEVWLNILLLCPQVEEEPEPEEEPEEQTEEAEDEEVVQADEAEEESVSLETFTFSTSCCSKSILN